MLKMHLSFVKILHFMRVDWSKGFLSFFTDSLTLDNFRNFWKVVFASKNVHFYEVAYCWSLCFSSQILQRLKRFSMNYSGKVRRIDWYQVFIKAMGCGRLLLNQSNHIKSTFAVILVCYRIYKEVMQALYLNYLRD